MSKSLHRPSSGRRAWSGNARKNQGVGFAKDPIQVELGGKVPKLRDRVRFERLQRADKPEKTKEEIRILWLKKRHEFVRLRKKYPEVDFDGPDRIRAKALNTARKFGLKP